MADWALQHGFRPTDSAGFAGRPSTNWVGDAGPGPSFIEAGGEDHPYTQKTGRWMAHNVTHLARILKEHPIPPEGNTVPGWQPDECRGHDDRMPAGHVG